MPSKAIWRDARERSLEIARANDINRSYAARVGVALQHTVVKTGCCY